MPPFTDDGTEEEIGKVTCPKSQNFTIATEDSSQLL